MRISLNWLNEYVDIADLAPSDVAQALTSIGLEVEGMESRTPFTEDVVVGVILEAVKHPNADTLRLCTVDIGEAEKLPIVCGAPNARQGLHVAVAKVGAALPGDFKIKKSKIRGETSCGMLCSESELGLSAESDGIIELTPGLALGTSVARGLGLSDTILTLNVTPNRGDALGHVGVARDLAAKLKRQLRLGIGPLKTDPALSTEARLKIKIEDAQACARFVGLYLEGVKVVPSPAWLQRRLDAAGMRPINLLVDATNYVMLEYGQPVHAYDRRFVDGGVLEAGVAKGGETLRTLDGQERRLEAGDLVIRDGKGLIGLAGLMGGASSEIRDDTTELAIEVASFDGRRIRRTARRLALHTEASHRFERGTDIDALPLVARRVATLIARGMTEAGLPPPRIADDFIDCFPGDVTKRVVALELGRARRLLGLSKLTRDESVEALVALGFELLDEQGDRLVFEVPFHRHDIEREVDLVEEIGRIVGFDRVPYALPVMSIQPTPEDPFIDFLETVRAALAQAGLRETVSFPFLAEAELAKLGVEAGHPLFPTLTLANPLSEQQRLLQTTLVPGLLRAAAQNRRNGQSGTRLFEVGRGYWQRTEVKAEGLWAELHRPSRHYGKRASLEAKAARPEGLRPTERSLVAAVIDQPLFRKSWNRAETLADFYEVKALLLALLKSFGITPQSLQLAAPRAGELPFLHPGASAVVTVNGKALGYVGELHPRAATQLELEQPAAPVVLELDAERLLDVTGRSLRLDTTPRRFPPISRDVAFLADKALTHERFLAALRDFKRKKHLTRSRLFDVYEGDKLPTGKKSMAYTFYFQSPEKTLTDQEVEQELGALTSFLCQQLSLTQRT